jgi:hypothetical protein
MLIAAAKQQSNGRKRKRPSVTNLRDMLCRSNSMGGEQRVGIMLGLLSAKPIADGRFPSAPFGGNRKAIFEPKLLDKNQIKE